MQYKNSADYICSLNIFDYLNSYIHCYPLIISNYLVCEKFVVLLSSQYWANFSGRVCALKLIFRLTSMPTCWDKEMTRKQSTNLSVGNESLTLIHQSINHFIVIRHDRTHNYTREMQ